MAGIALLSGNMGGDSAANRSERTGRVTAPVAAAAIDMPTVQPTPVTSLPITGEATIRRSTDGLFYVNASVGNDRIRFLVDTGANITVLTRADAERLGLTANHAANRGNMLQTAGGPAAMQWTKIPRMNVANVPVTDIDAAIIDRGIAVSLLGQNVLSRLNGMTFSGDQLQFH